VLFKLIQMQKVDADMLDQLIDRFEELDVEGEGCLDIGFDIPSADQVVATEEEEEEERVVAWFASLG
jgi:hypothetical protein